MNEGQLEGKQDFGEWVTMVFMYGEFGDNGAFSGKGNKASFFLLYNFS